MSNRLDVWAARWRVPPEAMAELIAIEAVDETEAGKAESSVVRACRLMADQCGGVLWRNNSGAAFDKTGRMIRYGLGNDSKKLSRDYKSPDLVGIAPGGRFQAVECKKPGWRGVSTDHEHAQANFGRHVVSLGGLFTFATSGDDVIKMLMRG